MSDIKGRMINRLSLLGGLDNILNINHIYIVCVCVTVLYGSPEEKLISASQIIYFDLHIFNLMQVKTRLARILSLSSFSSAISIILR